MQTAARLLCVGVFLFAAMLASYGAMIEKGEVTDTWGSPYVVGLLVFGVANLVAAGLAVLPGRSVTARVAGTLLLAPAVLLMNEHAGSHSPSWRLIAGAATLVVLGGLVAGRGTRASRAA